MSINFVFIVFASIRFIFFMKIVSQNIYDFDYAFMYSLHDLLLMKNIGATSSTGQNQ